MLALIDGDILVYRVGFTTMEDPQWVAQARMDAMIRLILENLKTDAYRCFLTSSDHSNFRYDVHPEYKSNRVAKKPTHYHFLRDYLVNVHGAELVYGQEADDALAQAQTPDTCIASIDKDLLQCPGWHYNFVKLTLTEVTPVEGLRSLYRQILTGDPGDDVPGIYGIGPVKAGKLINHLNTELDMYNMVLAEYTKVFGERAWELLNRNANLLYIRKVEGVGWQNPSTITPAIVPA
jgi:DNA polymerase I